MRFSKISTLLLAIAMVSCLLSACGSDVDVPEITRSNQPQDSYTEEATEPDVQAQAQTQDFTFLAEDVALVPGTVFDASVLPEAESVYQVPSCAVEGTDNVYNYGAFEITAFDDGTQELIYSILLLDPNSTTPEGLALGDDQAKMEELYGTDYTQEGTGCTYTGPNTQLSIIIQNGTIASIEYLMLTSN